MNHLMLIGLNYQPQRATGDKNFWVELVSYLSLKLDRITILSIRQHPIPEEVLQINECRIRIKYLFPKFLETPDYHYQRAKLFWKQGRFPAGLGVIEKTLQSIRIIKELNLIYKNEPYHHIHLMDNLGFVNRFIAKNSPVPVTVSAMAYQGKRPQWVYHKYLRISFNHDNLTVIPYSQTYYNRMVSLGIDVSRVLWIPWGVKLQNGNIYREEEKNKLLATLGLISNLPLILWTGYIQQIGKKDFLFAYHTARKSIVKGLKATFYFAFKPENFETEFTNYHHPEENIWVKPTTVAEFNLICQASNIFFSPIVNSQCIIAPPLTWLEMLNRGVPIVTTKVPGASEAITSGETGYLCASEEEMIHNLVNIVDRYRDMQSACLKVIKSKYNIEYIAKKYLQLIAH